MDIPALLRQIQIFNELQQPALERLAQRCVIRNTGTGHVLFTTGEQCRGLYFVIEGRVRIYRVNPDGKEQVLHIEGPGRPVAELPLFDGGTYPASAITLAPSRLGFVPREDFEALYRSSPDVAEVIIRWLGRRLRHLVHVIDTLAFRDVAARLAILFVGYAERDGVTTPEGVELTLDRTQEELALEIGAARESVSRAMRQLKDSGLVEVLEGGNKLRIPDVPRLRARASIGVTQKG